jgi:hypothetical protein
MELADHGLQLVKLWRHWGIENLTTMFLKEPVGLSMLKCGGRRQTCMKPVEGNSP